MLLACAATDGELAALPISIPGMHRVVSGVGIPATFAGLVALAPLPSLILNIGIAGAYLETGIAVGDIVLGASEVYGDIGFELPDAEGFRAIGDSPFGGFYRDALSTVRLPEWTLTEVPGADFRVHVGRGCTVNTCTGTNATGTRRRDYFGAAFETMEGAAVAQIGRDWGVPVCEIRAISNIAGDRDMRPENIQRALRNLRAYLETCLAAQR